jgi:ribosomal RNA small subunit methyltransferase A
MGSDESESTSLSLVNKAKRVRVYNNRPDFVPSTQILSAIPSGATAAASTAGSINNSKKKDVKATSSSSFREKVLQKAKKSSSSPSSSSASPSVEEVKMKNTKKKETDKNKSKTPRPTSISPSTIPSNPLYRGNRDSDSVSTSATSVSSGSSVSSVPQHTFKESVPPPAPDRPFTLPSGLFKPKQSLGQNYLSDQNYVNKIVNCFKEQRQRRFFSLPNSQQKSATPKETSEQQDEGGTRVVEIGPGAGALTRVLIRHFPKMKAIEIDQRAVALLNEKLPEVDVIHQDVLEFDWQKHFEERRRKKQEDSSNLPSVATNTDVSMSSKQQRPHHRRGEGLHIVANLPYHIVSQVLFSLADNHDCIDLAVVTMQYEVAERITAKPRTKEYGIPSVVFQLYGETLLNFKIPPKVFYPVPKVDSALVTIDFSKPHRELKRVHGVHLRK